MLFELCVSIAIVFLGLSMIYVLRTIRTLRKNDS